MQRSVVIMATGAARAVAALAAAGVALPAAASASAASAQSSWVAPALLALAIGLAVVALRATATAERAVVGKGDPASSGVFVITRDAAVARGEGPPPGAHPASLRPRHADAAPPAAAEPGGGAVLRSLSARMDDVSYEPGAPNVLSMTKRLDAGRPVAAAPVSVTCTRGEAGGETVVSVGGVLEAVVLEEALPVLEAVAESRPSAVLLELSGLQRVDAAGAAAIGRFAARCRELGGEVRAVGVARQPRAVFKLLRLDRALVGC